MLAKLCTKNARHYRTKDRSNYDPNDRPSNAPLQQLPVSTCFPAVCFTAFQLCGYFPRHTGNMRKEETRFATISGDDLPHMFIRTLGVPDGSPDFFPTFQLTHVLRPASAQYLLAAILQHRSVLNSATGSGEGCDTGFEKNTSNIRLLPLEEMAVQATLLRNLQCSFAHGRMVSRFNRRDNPG